MSNSKIPGLSELFPNGFPEDASQTLEERYLNVDDPITPEIAVHLVRQMKSKGCTGIHLRIKKTWGWMQKVFVSPTLEIWVCHADGPGHTSWHYHNWHEQVLFTISGTQYLEKRKSFHPDALPRRVKPSQPKVAYRRDVHRLVFKAAGTFIEVYKKSSLQPMASEDDIVREKV